MGWHRVGWAPSETTADSYLVILRRDDPQGEFRTAASARGGFWIERLEDEERRLGWYEDFVEDMTRDT